MVVHWGQVSIRGKNVIWKDWVLTELQSHLLKVPHEGLIIFVVAMLSIEKLDSNKTMHHLPDKKNM